MKYSRESVEVLILTMRGAIIDEKLLYFFLLNQEEKATNDDGTGRYYIQKQ